MNDLLRDKLRRWGLGRAVYLAWHRPAAAFRKSSREGGPLEQWRTWRGRLAMQEAATMLPAIPAGGGTALELHVLTGDRFWYQTAFCLWTFGRHAGCALRPVIYDDGTLAPLQVGHLRRIFPDARFISQAETIARLDTVLPAARFPSLRERWLHYPNIRKLIDVHAGSSGWKLVVDSDLLFFRGADALVEWLRAPALPLHALDCVTSYGYSRPLMNTLAQADVPDLVNAGVTGLESASLDWDQLEAWCRTLIEREGTHYYLEQALLAMLVARGKRRVIPRDEYVTLPAGAEARDCRAVMHHYVAESKSAYFRSNWRVAMKRAGVAA